MTVKSSQQSPRTESPAITLSSRNPDGAGLGGKPRIVNCSRSRMSAKSFALASSMTSKIAPPARVAEEALEADRVDQICVCTQLRKDKSTFDSSTVATFLLFDVEPGDE
jgi:hypothetical protein